MIDPKRQAALDQAQTCLTEMFPMLWWGLYVKLVAEGFDELQAFDLLKTYILSQCPGGIRSLNEDREGPELADWEDDD